MSENQIKIEVRGKVATLTEQNFTLVGGNNDYEVVFDFDEDWNAHIVKTALFVFGEKSVSKVFEGNVCEGVEINAARTCFIGVFAGNIVTTTPAEVKSVEYSITDIGGLPEDPTPSVYNQIIELINKYIAQGGGNVVSPTVQIIPIENGNRVVITDINGAKSFDIKNGKSAYEFAKEGGYVGTEDEFSSKLSQQFYVSREMYDDIITDLGGLRFSLSQNGILTISVKEK